MKKLDKKGFSVIEVLLLVVLVIAIASVGYYVYRARRNTNSAYNNAANAQTVTKPIAKPKTPSPKATTTTTLDKTYTGTLNYANDSHNITIMYPSGWTVTNDGTNVKLTDGKGSITFHFGYISFTGDEPGYKNVTTDFAVDGVPFVDATTSYNKADGSTFSYHSIRFKDAATKETDFAKTNLQGLPLVKTVDYPTGSASQYQDALTRIYLSFKVQ